MISRTLILSCVFILTSSVLGQLSPGDLHQKHEHLEGVAQCVRCHEIGTKEFRSQCLSCHALVKDRIEQGLGLHAQAAYSTCETCHSDHHGRTFEMVHWPNGTEKFDHSLTGFTLKGTHAKAACRDCHNAKSMAKPELLKAVGKDLERTFLGLAATCASCHVDPHREQFGKDCMSCHREDSWKPAALFDHQKAAFSLKGAHRDVSCEQCHALESEPEPFRRFKPIAHDDCTDCHADDTHFGQFKQDCVTCHVENHFKPASQFDHQQASFPLTGKHKLVECEGCHTLIRSNNRSVTYVRYANIQHQVCSDCHRDPHQSRLGARCEDCHQTSGWQDQMKAFDHAKTRYPLKGKHIDVACRLCHSENKVNHTIAFMHCNDCHSDSHIGQFKHRPSQGECGECHQVEGFLPAQFGVNDHAECRFPLKGAHLATPCVQCHTTQPILGVQTQKFRFEQQTCDACHVDPHDSQQYPTLVQLGCEGCHQDTSWRNSIFDHKLTSFPLEGEHQKARCSDCHVFTDPESKVFTSVDSNCSSCHSDPHRSQFAARAENQCASCHQSTQWDALVFDHQHDSRFNLEGAHIDVACNQCHPSQQDSLGTFTRYTPIDIRCETCHDSAGGNQ